MSSARPSDLEGQQDTASEVEVEQGPANGPREEEKDGIVVTWDGDDDKENPQNWSTSFKSWVTLQLSLLAFTASLASSIIAPANKTIAEYVGVSEEVVVLNVSLYVIGFALGPLVWAPSSEIWGRRISILPAMFCLALFSIGTATSKNAASVFITRFFSGVFGSSAVSNVNAALGDIWSREARGTAVSLYAVCVVGGPTLGPIFGAAILVNPRLGWRWTEYITAIINFAVVALAYFCMPEMYGPVVLKRKAQRLRKETGNQKLYHPHERLKLDFKSIVTKQLSRPLKMLCVEPMVTCIAFYASFVYSILYLTLEVFPIVFTEQRKYSPIVASLPFLGLFIGVLCALGINLGNQPRYIRKCREAQGKPVPEARLPPLAIGAVLMVIGLFWFGWNAEPQFSWVLPSIAAVFIGAGFNTIFQQCKLIPGYAFSRVPVLTHPPGINYLVDVYGLYAASATAANTFLRSLMAFALPLVARPMFHNLGVGPAMSILGGVAALMLPVPFLLMKFSMPLRKKSTFAPVPED
ncbi:hypothetical protein H2202_005056 [Exophiala xenobiotica]|nr:hypothetical protein H2202_005056 [Exophiala xenobiotica]KAK5233370.1 hypothetical protein LTR47_005463 [Exophiala xenobiotica]KAK5245868.1 hypothetical protein LTS06_008768 [Exophiala xenobiotica]KAK5345537.1 hypothetical protein LTR61_010660 [Exophiala xenobiotica]KAK5364612.1 hypothetical protein LTR11_008752 [Exophiala xenobiotica]